MRASGFFDEFGFQLHGAKTVDLAVDVVVAFDQADVFDLGADLDDRGGALDLQVLDQSDGVAVLKDVPRSVFENFSRFNFGLNLLRPLMSALRTDKIIAIFVCQYRLAFGAIGQGHESGQGVAGERYVTL